MKGAQLQPRHRTSPLFSGLGCSVYLVTSPKVKKRVEMDKQRKTFSMSNEELADGVEFGRIVPADGSSPPTFWRSLGLQILLSVLWTLKVTVMLIPASLYFWLVAEYWEYLKAEGVTVWQAGSGLVALYGLALHWWRTSVQERRFKAEREQVRLLNTQFHWQLAKEAKENSKGSEV